MPSDIDHSPNELRTYVSLSLVQYRTTSGHLHEKLIYHGVFNYLEDDLCVAVFCVDLCFKSILVFAAHMKNVLLLKISQYYTLANLAFIIVLEVVGLHYSYLNIYYIVYVPLFIVGCGINLYLYLLIRSLARKLEMAVQNGHVQLTNINGQLIVEEESEYPIPLTSEHL